MSSPDLDARRVADALRAFVDELPDPADARPAPRADARSSRRRWAVAVAALAAALAVVGVLAARQLGPVGHEPQPTGPGDGAAYLPSRLPGYAFWTGFAAQSPPGRVLLTWRQQPGLDPLGTQSLVLSADGQRVRRVGEAEADSPEQVATRLSPDGTTLAVGAGRSPGTVTLVDLGSGRVAATMTPCPESEPAVPAAWSPDADILWVVCTDRQSPSSEGVGRLVRVRVADGTSRAVPGDTAVAPGEIVVSPDGRYVTTGAARLVLDADTLRRVGGPWELDGPVTVNGWSPDGRRLLYNGFNGLSVVDLTGARQSGRPRTVWESDLPVTVLGWTSDTEALVLVPRSGPSSPPDRIVALEVASGTHRVVCTLDDTRLGGSSTDVQMADGLTRGLVLGPPRAVDRGPVPWGVVGFLGGALVALGALVAGGLAWRGRRRNRSVR